MLATDKLVFIHLHKSGGTFVNQYLLRHASGARRIGYHLPYWKTPAELRSLPVLGTIRSPLGYYLSWFHFQSAMRRPNALFKICSDGGTLGFEVTVRNLAALATDRARLRRLEADVPEDFVANGLNLTKRCVRQLRGFGGGFYSFLCMRMYSGAERLHLIETSRLRAELPLVLARLGEQPDRNALAFLRDAPDLNTSCHDSVEAVYDPRLRREIIDLEAFAEKMLETLRRGAPPTAFQDSRFH